MDASTTSPLVAALSDIGLRRKENQDSYGHFRGEGPAAAKGHLVVVADGMGGHQGGGVASRLAVDTIVGAYRDAAAGAPPRPPPPALAPAPPRPPPPPPPPPPACGPAPPAPRRPPRPAPPPRCSGGGPPRRPGGGCR